jgi:hypothetical protein
MRLVGAIEKSPLFAGVSLGGFIGAGLIFGQLGSLVGELSAVHLTLGHGKRSWLLFNVFIQIISLAICVILAFPSSSPKYGPSGDFGWVYLLTLAMQGGIQVTQVSNPTANLTPGRECRCTRTTHRHDDHSLCRINLRSTLVPLRLSPGRPEPE